MLKSTSLLRRWFAISAIALLPGSLMAAERAFPPTPPGVTEVKTLPAGTLLKSTAPGSYFDQSNRLFSPLFRYISQHDIAMTVPVEAQIDQAAMFFWVAPDQVDKVAGNADGVEVLELPARRVASHGARGGYSEDNYRATVAALRAWLSEQSGLEVTGEPYAVYWNGPFTPWFLRRFEVHIPITEIAAASD